MNFSLELISNPILKLDSFNNFKKNIFAITYKTDFNG